MQKKIKNPKKRSKRNRKPNNNVYGARTATKFYDNDHDAPLRYLGLIMPTKMITNLRFDTTGTLNNVGSPYMYYSFRPTAPYDVDANPGGGSVPGFNAWAALYGYYRVLKFEADVTYCNAENFGVTVVLTPLNYAPSSVTFDIVQSYVSQKHARYQHLSAKGGMDRVRFRLTVDCAKFIGSAAFKYADSYASVVTNVPTNNIYVPIAAFSANNFSSGVYHNTSFTMQVEFYNELRINA